MYDRVAAIREAVAVLTTSADSIPRALCGPIEDRQASVARASAVHDRVDRLMLGRPAAARKRVARLLSKPKVQPTTLRALDVDEELARAAVKAAESAHVRVTSLLTLDHERP